MKNIEELRKFIKENIENKKETSFGNLYSEILMNTDYLLRGEVSKIFYDEIMKSERKDYVYQNIDKILKEQFYNNSDGLLKSRLMEYIRQDNPEKYKELYLKFIKFIFHYKKYDEFTNECTYDISIDDKTAEYFGYLLNEYAKNQNTESSKLEWVGCGSYSDVFKLGNKIIKFGRERIADEIPEHPLILKSNLKKKIKVNDSNTAIIEVQDEVEHLGKTDFKKNEEILYEVFKKLRESGIVWVDARYENIGKRKDNGEYVIFDTDAIYTEEYFNSHIDEIKKKIILSNYKTLEEKRLKEFER